MNKIIIDLLRHGDVANGKKLRGRTDDHLSELGWKQMMSHINSHQLPWQKIVSSNLLRCKLFSEKISEKFAIPLDIEPHFQEIDFGLWDGRLLAELYESEDSEKLLQFLALPSSVTPPEGERYEDFKVRVLKAWDTLLASLHKDKVSHCLLVTHGGVIKVILSDVLGLPEENLHRLEVPHAGLSRISHYDGSQACLTFHNGQL